jgi:CRP/FNR family cyclic AMP-dependent transcriptional regulator
MTSDELTLLAGIPLFAFMDQEEIKGIFGIMASATYAPGQVIMQEGELGEDFYILVQGTVQTIIRDVDGNELMVDEIGPGGFFGELSMLTGAPRAAEVKAVDAVHTLALDRDEFYTFLMQHPHAAIDVLKVLGMRLHRTDRMLRRSVSRNVNTIDEARMTFGQRIADTVAAFMGSWRFIIMQSTLLIIWIILNVSAWVNHWDPYPFILLNLALSFQAAYSAPFIMMSQNRQSAKDRISAEIDHEVNRKAELEVGLLLSRVDNLQEMMITHLGLTKAIEPEHDKRVPSSE